MSETLAWAEPPRLLLPRPAPAAGQALQEPARGEESMEAARRAEERRRVPRVVYPHPGQVNACQTPQLPRPAPHPRPRPSPHDRATGATPLCYMSLTDVRGVLGPVTAAVTHTAARCPRRAVLCCAVLCCAVLCCAVLCCAVLCCAVLCCASQRPASPAEPPHEPDYDPALVRPIPLFVPAQHAPHAQHGPGPLPGQPLPLRALGPPPPLHGHPPYGPHVHPLGPGGPPLHPQPLRQGLPPPHHPPPHGPHHPPYHAGPPPPYPPPHAHGPSPYGAYEGLGRAGPPQPYHAPLPLHAAHGGHGVAQGAGSGAAAVGAAPGAAHPGGSVAAAAGGGAAPAGVAAPETTALGLNPDLLNSLLTSLAQGPGASALFPTPTGQQPAVAPPAAAEQAELSPGR